MDKKRKNDISSSAQAPGIDPDDSYGKDATKEEIDKGEYTPVTRLVYDEYEASKESGKD